MNLWLAGGFALLIALGGAITGCHGASTATPAAARLHPIVRIVPARSGRASSWDRAGGNLDCRVIEPGEIATLADIAGPGVITHLYCTMVAPDPLDYRDAVIRIYWDGAAEPSVAVPLGDFFCIPHGRPRHFDSAMVSVTPGRGRHPSHCGMNCYFPMPFATRARIELVNESERTLGGALGRLWYHIDYELHETPPPEDTGRFHAEWRRERTTIPPDDTASPSTANEAARVAEGNYVLLETIGEGHVAGLFLQIDNVKGGWFGEGDDMVFIDGDRWPPSLPGTGTEEIFGAGALPDRAFTGFHSGFLQVENKQGEVFAGKNAMYRWYLRDPIRFRREIRMTIEHGHANRDTNDFTSVVYWYQKRPRERCPPLPAPAERRARWPARFFAAQSKGAEVNTLLLPYRLAQFGRGRPLPAWMDALGVPLMEAYQQLWDGRYDDALRTYETALRVIRKHRDP